MRFSLILFFDPKIFHNLKHTPPKAVRKYIKALKKYNKDHKAVWLKGADHFQNSLFFRHKLEFYSEVEKYLKTDCFKNTEELAER